MSSLPRLAWIVDRLDVRPTDAVLEIGCGHGIATGPVLDRVTTGRYVGLDRSPAMVAAGERRHHGAVEGGRARFVCGAVPGADLGDTPFDRVFAARVSDMATPEGLAFAARHLAPGGVLLLAFDAPGADRTGAQVRAVTGLLAPAGLGPPTIVSGTVAGHEVTCVVASAP